jgi:TPR repeat protein
VHFLSLAAHRNHPAAQNSLALAYFKGLGTQKDFRLGAYLYQQSANQNNTVGQYNCGICYVYGTGVRQNEEEAGRRFRQAAAKGHSKAQSAVRSLQSRREQVK